MVELAATVKIRDSAGTLVLDLNAGGYWVVSVTEPDQTWRRVVVTSPFVDGNHEAHSVLDGAVFEVVVRIEGATWVQVEQRRVALKAAVAPTSWLLELAVEGVSSTYRANRPDSSSSISAADIVGRRRFVTLRIPVQPTPAMTGI